MPITDVNGVQRHVEQVAYARYSYGLQSVVAVINTTDGFRFEASVYGESCVVDADNETYSAAYNFYDDVIAFQNKVKKAHNEAIRMAQLYPGDSVLVSDEYDDEDYAGCRLTYVGPGVLKDRYGNVCEVPANQYRKVGNGPRTPKSELTGTTAYELLRQIDLNNIDHVLVCMAIDELYDAGKLVDHEVKNLNQWGASGYTNLLG